MGKSKLLHDVLKNYKKAVYWFEKAAKKGNASAQAVLGLMYEKGQGVLKNYKKAYMWYNIASFNESITAKKGLEILERNMPTNQIYQAQEMATKCYESEYKDCGS